MCTAQSLQFSIAESDWLLAYMIDSSSAYRCILAAAFPYSESRHVTLSAHSYWSSCARLSAVSVFPDHRGAAFRLLTGQSVVSCPRLMELSAAGDRVFAAEAILKRRVRKVRVFSVSERFAACV